MTDGPGRGSGVLVWSHIDLYVIKVSKYFKCSAMMDMFGNNISTANVTMLYRWYSYALRKLCMFSAKIEIQNYFFHEV